MTPEQPHYGVDVAVRRSDDLDKLLLAEISQVRDNCRVLDIGCGAGGQSGRMAATGAEVHAIDITNYADAFWVLRRTLKLAEHQLRFTHGDARTILPTLATASYSIICLQRTIHYLSYDEARTLLTTGATIVTNRLFISATGLNSAIGRLHPLRAQSVDNRFATLPVTAAKTFDISAPLCVYTEVEFTTLLHQSGWQVERIWTSAFGNIKVIAIPIS